MAREGPPAQHPRPRGDHDGSRRWDERGSGVPASRHCIGDIGRAFATEKLRVKGSDRGKKPFFFLPQRAPCVTERRPRAPSSPRAERTPRYGSFGAGGALQALAAGRSTRYRSFSPFVCPPAASSPARGTGGRLLLPPGGRQASRGVGGCWGGKRGKINSIEGFWSFWRVPGG